MPLRLLSIICLILALAATGCRSGARSAQTSAFDRESVDPPKSLPPTDPASLRFHKVDMLITQWDVAQASGRLDQAEQLAAQIRVEVDQGYPEFVSASRGQRGLQLQYLATSALGFTSNPQATQVLLDRLGDSDRRLVGNALIALKVRADPNTSILPLTRHVTAPGTEPRRYAPLAIAAVLDARWRTGRGVDSATHKQVAHALSGVVADRDPHVRLHAAKALGSLRGTGTYELLAILLKDEHMRIRLAAASGMERLGDPRGFTEVVRLLGDAPDETKPVIRDLLTSYGEKVARRKLTPQEIQENATSAQAWGRWYEKIRQEQGLPYEGTLRSATVPQGANPPCSPNVSPLKPLEPYRPGTSTTTPRVIRPGTTAPPRATTPLPAPSTPRTTYPTPAPKTPGTSYPAPAPAPSPRTYPGSQIPPPPPAPR